SKHSDTRLRPGVLLQGPGKRACTVQAATRWNAPSRAGTGNGGHRMQCFAPIPPGDPTMTTLVEPRVHDLGNGFLVRRAVPTLQARSVGPFVFVDHVGPVVF